MSTMADKPLGSAADTKIIIIANPATGAMEKITLSQLKTYCTTGDTTPPTIVSVTAISATVLRFVYSENVTMTLAGHSFKKNGAAWAASSVSGAGSTWDVAMSTAAISTDTLLRTYDSTTGSTLDASSNELVSYTDQAVTNSIPGATLEDLVFSTAHGLSVASLNWSGSDASTYYMNWGVATKSIPSGQDGYIQAKYTATDGENAIIGIDSDATDERIKPTGTTQPFDWQAGAYIYSGTIYYFEAAVNITSTAVTISVGDYWRISRTGSVWKVQKSPDGTTWSDAVTLAYAGTGQTYLKANIDTFTVGTTKLYQPKGYNVS